MSDAAAAIQAALLAALPADAGVRGAFGTALVRVYEVPPVNAVCPYVTLQSAFVTPDLAEGMDLCEVETTPVVWTLSDPPSVSSAQILGAAVLAACLALDAVAGFRVQQARAIRSTYLLDHDGKTAKGAIAVRYATDPL